MKYRALSLAACAILAACTPTGQQVYSNRAVQISEACGSFGTALRAAAAKREAGELSVEQIDRINIAINEIKPICDNPAAATTGDAALAVSNAAERILLEVQ